MTDRRRYTFVLYTAIAVAAAATFGVYRVLESSQAANRIETQPVVTAARELPEGSAIQAADVTVAQVPVALVPTGAYSTPDSLYGRVTRVAVFPGEALVPGRLAPDGTGPGLEVKITPGKRAMAVRINDVAGLSGLIQPNSRVDVLVTIRDERGEMRGQVAKLFMENMRVLSVGTRVERDADGKPMEAPTAALEVTPQEAERLAVAANQGAIQLVLRGYGDPDSVKTMGASARDVLTALGEAPVRDAAPRPRPAPRPVSRPPQPAPVQPAAAPVVAPAPVRPESARVLIIRGTNVETRKFEKADSTKRPPP
jgi:pilus assembly protein CpaB